MYKICNNLDYVEFNDFFFMYKRGSLITPQVKLSSSIAKPTKENPPSHSELLHIRICYLCTTKFAICTNSFKNLLDGDPKFQTKFYEYDGPTLKSKPMRGRIQTARSTGDSTPAPTTTTSTRSLQYYAHTKNATVTKRKLSLIFSRS